MPRVSTETIEKLTEYIDSLSEDTRNKCALCNTTLTHLVKTAEAKTGAGTLTVTRALADKINETAAPQDKVNAEALRSRVLWEDGTNKKSLICRESTNKSDSEIEEPDEPIANLIECEEQIPIIAFGEKEILDTARQIQSEKREQKRQVIIEKLESVQAIEAKAVEGVYDVVVIDPPWPMQKIERNERPNQSEFDYPVMTEEELSALTIPCSDDCHVWIWTTHKFLPMAFRLIENWKLKYVCAFTWHKPGGFQPFGLPQYNSEFALYARKGTPTFIDTKAFPVCFEAPRGAHSEKPEEFYDVIRRTTAGRKIDMFNRRKINGFDGWGKEAIE